MRLIVGQSQATGFIPINTRQQRASLPFTPGVLERKVYKGCNTLLYSGLAKVNIWKRKFYPLSVAQISCHSVASGSALFVMINLASLSYSQDLG